MAWDQLLSFPTKRISLKTPPRTPATSPCFPPTITNSILDLGVGEVLEASYLLGTVQICLGIPRFCLWGIILTILP